MQLFIAEVLVGAERLGNEVEHAHAGVQRRVWVLENHLDIAPQGFQLFGRHFGNILAFKQHFAAAWVQQADDAVACGGFAAAAFPHKAQRLARADGKTDAVHRAHILFFLAKRDPVGHVEILFQALHFQQIFRAFFNSGVFVCHVQPSFSASRQRE